jgi:hypothetical protein
MFHEVEVVVQPCADRKPVLNMASRGMMSLMEDMVKVY